MPDTIDLTATVPEGGLIHIDEIVSEYIDQTNYAGAYGDNDLYTITFSITYTDNKSHLLNTEIKGVYFQPYSFDFECENDSKYNSATVQHFIDVYNVSYSSQQVVNKGSEYVFRTDKTYEAKFFMTDGGEVASVTGFGKTVTDVTKDTSTNIWTAVFEDLIVKSDVQINITEKQ